MSEPSGEQVEPLRLRARELMSAGKLPRDKAIRTWGGSGSGLPCELCGAPIESSQPEFEIQLDLAPGSRSYRFHRTCHAVWDEMRGQLLRIPWTRVASTPPPLGLVVEARVALGGGRSIILNVYREEGLPGGEQLFLNATTRAVLPDGWIPIEWRTLQALDGDLTAPADAQLRFSATAAEDPDLHDAAPSGPTQSSDLPRRA